MNRIWNFSAFGSRPALTDDTGVTVRYNELAELQDQLAGIGPGELTMMLCENSIGALAGYAALINSGHPMLMVSSGMPEDMRRNIMNTYRPGMVFAPRLLQKHYSNMQELRTIDDYVLLKTNYSEQYSVFPELGQLLTTSGSTGSVKFVRQSRSNILINAMNYAVDLGITETERTVTSLPLHYTYALTNYSASLLTGAVMVVTRLGIMDEEFWDLFENERVTAFHNVSAAYDMLCRMEIFSGDFPHLRLMTQAGSKLSRELHRYYARYAEKYGKRFIPMYGQCEATSGITYLPADRAPEKIGSVGIVVPGGEIELTDAEGNPVEEAHVSGELVYRGKNVALGYASCGGDLIRGDDWNGVLRTGDLAERDEDGFLYITGRLRRFIKVSGHRISLDEIDERIMDDLHIRAVCSGTDDNLVIFVLSDRDKSAVYEYVCRKISVVRPVFRVQTIEAFPVNEAGKILYSSLAELTE